MAFQPDNSPVPLQQGIQALLRPNLRPTRTPETGELLEGVGLQPGVEGEAGKGGEETPRPPLGHFHLK